MSWDFIEGSDERPCWNCGIETNIVSIIFETPMCSEYCEDVKYLEYEKEIEKMMIKDQNFSEVEEILLAQGLGETLTDGSLKSIGPTGSKDLDRAISEAIDAVSNLEYMLKAHGINEF